MHLIHLSGKVSRTNPFNYCDDAPKSKCSASSRHGGCMPAMALMAVMAVIGMVQASVPDLNLKHEVELFYAASLGPQS